MKIGLGTVQFGLDYGISNGRGRTPPPEVARILDLARRAGIGVLDTAPAYGESETVLGEAAAGAAGFRIVTKTPKFGDAAGPAEQAAALERSLRESLRRLGVERVHGLLFHQASDLRGSQGEWLMGKARELQARGWVAKVGVSVYEGRDIDEVMGRHEVDLIQFPANVLDQRLLASGHLARLKSAGVELHARSAFLQGLLLMEPGTLPAGLAGAREPLQAFRTFAAGRGWSPMEAALGFVVGIPEVDVVLCGVNDAAQLEAILAAASPLDPGTFARLASGDPSLLNPSAWEVRR